MSVHEQPPAERPSAEPSPETSSGMSRKTFLVAVGLGALALPAAASAAASPAQARVRPRVLKPTPKCDDGDDEPTPAQIEGPYFKPGSPERTTLTEPGMPGTPLTVSGTVYSMSCQPVAHALLDFWQADDYGNYDNTGYTLRGHQYTDASGRFTLTTIVPGLYPGRTRHVHVKAQAPYQDVLTTQLYFPGEPRNQTDMLFDPELLMDVQDGPDGRSARFDFVLQVW
ncbi:dioxygenase [Actinomadura verrucosospora]|uniref:Intradiol ring-cleavage dioxygenase n=1 Tax=Actinomadura verrucosospora TaxID=46165 RepID=A0A7D3VQE0_ACTVE|nr:dioxygenase [Actinomadura verrucosospora]QKG20280.1 Intradiol ring-cleavage dioxygenase [Actinomadura verrucosospora]